VTFNSDIYERSERAAAPLEELPAEYLTLIIAASVCLGCLGCPEVLWWDWTENHQNRPNGNGDLMGFNGI
jgi:hypothetical protein